MVVTILGRSLSAIAGVAMVAGVAAAAGAAPAAEARARAAVEALLATQSEAWNRGDLSSFTAVYADDATFLSPSGLTHGRAGVLARYRERYPDRKAMGKLTLEVTEARPLGFDPAGEVIGLSVAARWRLAYPDEPERKPAEGLTLLVLRRSSDRWEILQDASM
jgi:uncharacterized protein (TIGR02246 family)